MNAGRFYKRLQDFCGETPNGPAASGHTLHEENIIMQVPLDGDKIEALKRFDVPGLDMLTSNPVAYFWGAWRAAAYPCSTAIFTGERRVMTEVSDHSEVNYGDCKAVPLELMEATAAWQAAFGVTEFTLYYGVDGGQNAPYRNAGSHADYCRYVGRLNAVLRDATPTRPVILYYPIEELQEEYLPVAQVPTPETQSARMRALFTSFNALGEALTRRGISFVVANRATLQNLTKTPSDLDEAERLAYRFSAVIFPNGSERIARDWNAPMLELWADEIVEKTVETWIEAAAVIDKLGESGGPRWLTEAGFADLVQGAFEREGRVIFVLSNPGENAWSGNLRLVGASRDFTSDEWTIIDPKTG
ncbi:MAG: hypothetical protein HUK22_00325, partial [Thermoguttaceae bacterium]|nr:hypothetical protein [Thermoguttaceae bacterium]